MTAEREHLAHVHAQLGAGFRDVVQSRSRPLTLPDRTVAAGAKRFARDLARRGLGR